MAHRKVVADGNRVVLQIVVQHVVHIAETALRGFVFREMAHDDALQLPQDASYLKLMEHAVDLRHALVGVLDEENQSFAGTVQEVVIRPGQTAKHRHIAAHEPSTGLARLVERVGSHPVAWHATLQHVVKQLVHRVAHRIFHGQSFAHGAVDAHHARRHLCAVQGRRIAESHQPFGVLGKHPQRCALQHLYGSVAAPAAHDGAHRRILQGPLKVGSPLVGGSGKAMVAIEGVPAHHGHVAPCPQGLAALADGHRVGGTRR